jgi:leucyl-tRNA---protein transferase
VNKYKLPVQHNPKRIDELLAIGWFRMGQSMHTNRFVQFHAKIYRTVWLRHQLANYSRTTTFKKLIKRNKNFKISFEPLSITPAHLALYENYKNAMPFDISDSIENLLFCFAHQSGDVFNTYQINLHDGDKLIACSYLDFGFKSAEGISSYYDPDYAQYSLGKYLIYLQIDICYSNQLDFFYPGYFVPFYPHLDYKLSIGKSFLEYYAYDNNLWESIENYKIECIPMEMKPQIFTF